VNIYANGTDLQQAQRL